MKIPNKREFQQIALNHSSDVDPKDFILFKLMMQLYHQIILYLEIFLK